MIRIKPLALIFSLKAMALLDEKASCPCYLGFNLI
jgi:hypothetical protein